MSLGRRIALGGVVVGAALYFWPQASPGVPGAPVTTFKTTSVQNVEKAYANGGATSTHTKAYGGTVQGQKQDGPMREGSATNNPKGYQQEGIGHDQRPTDLTKPEKWWNKTMLGSEKGK
ncbi:uncharacterized protein Z520_06654 [Fonsecaea multimorphosa CBS 102226]|uniref:Uncharacterized protein n=1 Tax=Fonsecaea multimorphosa CBS 102226 TaxID=1442371 RepID=A0A0D2ILK0_9EURO|nr:uncharacterized protein Z520_06654 [Fonsecaea multimorphosa CBS 102226]KIX97876.1 hypothetical protein Z520_06654 [Fonsecaea multimorphosa CBS 102226]OAL23643.1 hypothetical protein AYO22_06220 [Fonsecaea multimorphosa]